MIWPGETASQRLARASEWQRHFCLVPRQMKTGHWVWLQCCERRRDPMAAGLHWQYRLPGSGWRASWEDLV